MKNLFRKQGIEGLLYEGTERSPNGLARLFLIPERPARDQADAAALVADGVVGRHAIHVAERVVVGHPDDLVEAVIIAPRGRLPGPDQVVLADVRRLVADGARELGKGRLGLRLPDRVDPHVLLGEFLGDVAREVQHAGL